METPTNPTLGFEIESRGRAQLTATGSMTPNQIESALDAARGYFYGELGFRPDTPTRAPTAPGWK